MNQSRKTQMDIMKSVSNLSNFDEMKTSMIELEKELKEVFYLFSYHQILFYLKKKIDRASF